METEWYYYVEFIDGQLKSYGKTFGPNRVDDAVKKTTGMIKEITKKQFEAVDGCSGNLELGIKRLSEIQDYIKNYSKEQKEIEDESGEDPEK